MNNDQKKEAALKARRKANERYYNASEELEKKHDKACLKIEHRIERLLKQVNAVERELYKQQSRMYDDASRRIEKLWVPEAA